MSPRAGRRPPGAANESATDEHSAGPLRPFATNAYPARAGHG